jgi:hypothetical protein
LAFSYWIDIPWFRTEGKLAAIFIETFSWGSQLAGHLLHQLHANKFSSTIHHHAITEPEEVMMIEETWMQPYLAYMINKALPEDTVEAKRIIR